MLAEVALQAPYLEKQPWVRRTIFGQAAAMLQQLAQRDRVIVGVNARFQVRKRLLDGVFPTELALFYESRGEHCGHRFGAGADVEGVVKACPLGFARFADTDHRLRFDAARIADQRAQRRRARRGAYRFQLLHQFRHEVK